MCLWRPFFGTGTHYSTARATAWRVAEPIAKFSREVGVVAKAAGIGDVAERLACVQQRPALLVALRSGASILTGNAPFSTQATVSRRSPSCSSTGMAALLR